MSTTAMTTTGIDAWIDEHTEDSDDVHVSIEGEYNGHIVYYVVIYPSNDIREAQKMYVCAICHHHYTTQFSHSENFHYECEH